MTCAMPAGSGRQPRMRQEPHRLVFVDETATTTKMTRLHGRARRHRRLMARAPFGHWRTQTFVAALRCDGLTAPWIIDRPMNRGNVRSLRRNPARADAAGRHPRQPGRSQERKSRRPSSKSAAPGSSSCRPTARTD